MARNNLSSKHGLKLLLPIQEPDNIENWSWNKHGFEIFYTRSLIKFILIDATLKVNNYYKEDWREIS